MSRSGYIEPCDSEEYAKVNLWRGAVRRAALGKRGQKAIQDLADALDAMPEKRLVAGLFKTSEGAHCALGALASHRDEPLERLAGDNPDALDYCFDEIASVLDIAPSLAAEIMFLNDEQDHSTDEDRWKYIRRWCERALKGDV